MPIEETLSALDDLVRQGKVRYTGCSNYTGYRLTESLWTAERRGLERFASLQLQWSLVVRDAERELVAGGARLRPRRDGLEPAGARLPLREVRRGDSRRRRAPGWPSGRTPGSGWTRRMRGAMLDGGAVGRRRPRRRAFGRVAGLAAGAPRALHRHRRRPDGGPARENLAALQVKLTSRRSRRSTPPARRPGATRTTSSACGSPGSHPACAAGRRPPPVSPGRLCSGPR